MVGFESFFSLAGASLGEVGEGLEGDLEGLGEELVEESCISPSKFLNAATLSLSATIIHTNYNNKNTKNIIPPTIQDSFLWYLC